MAFDAVLVTLGRRARTEDLGLDDLDITTRDNGTAAVNALFGRIKKFKVDYRVIPWATFTAPKVALLSLNEDEARAKGIERNTASRNHQLGSHTRTHL